MIDVWLLVVTIICFVIMVILNLYILAVYIHPDDKGFLNGFFEKLIILLASCVLWAFILLLPLDIANSRGYGAGFNIDTVFQILFVIYLVFLVCLLPFILFLYETDEESSCLVRFFKALVYTVLIALIVLILGLVAWGTLKTASIGIVHRELEIKYFSLSESKTTIKIYQASVDQEKLLNYEVPVFVFGVVFIIFLGWFLFVMFGGIGMSALPMDLIIDYMYRYPF